MNIQWAVESNVADILISTLPIHVLVSSTLTSVVVKIQRTSRRIKLSITKKVGKRIACIQFFQVY